MSQHTGRQRLAQTFCIGIALSFSASCLAAQDLRFGFNNPSFGGNPGYSTHLFATANAQRSATASDANESGAFGGSGFDDGTDSETSRADLFLRQLEGRLLSALAAEVTAAIFGEDQQDSGTVQFGDTTITFERTAGAITLTIIDVLDGTSTTITVPQLVTASGS